MRSMVEGSLGSNMPRMFEDRLGDDPTPNSCHAEGPLHRTACGPPPRSGEDVM